MSTYTKRAFSTILLIGCILSTAGCATGAGARWYAPASWFSHSAANAVDNAAVAQTAAEGAAVKAAQTATHKTQEALAVAPASRPVDVAKRSNDTAVALLDQVEGPLTAEAASQLKQTVAALLSDNADIRAKAEATEAATSAQVGEISNKLAAAVRDSQTANANLRTAFDRENALANELRAQQAMKWILAGASVLAAAGYLYVRYFLGGLPSAVGTMIAGVQKKSPEAAGDVRNLLDYALHNNPSMQAQIAAAVAKAL